MYTAVTAARPGEPFLEEALDSVHEQTLPAAQVMVILNGDPLRTEIDRRMIARKFPRVEILQSPVPRVAHALNSVLQRVHTRYVAFLDADDSWLPEKQILQIEMLTSREDLDAVVGRTLNRRSDPSGGDQHRMPVTSRLFGATTFTRMAFSVYGMPDPQADHFTWLYRWWSGAQESGIRIHHHPEVVLRRRIHESNGWVMDNHEGRRQLLGELRRIHAAKEHR